MYTIWVYCSVRYGQEIESKTQTSDVFHRWSLLWRHNGSDGVSNHQSHDCLLNRSFRRRSKKTPKLRVTGLCAGNSPITGEFPAQMASNSENVSIWWRHHVPPISQGSGIKYALTKGGTFTFTTLVNILSTPAAAKMNTRNGSRERRFYIETRIHMANDPLTILAYLRVSMKRICISHPGYMENIHISH